MNLISLIAGVMTMLLVAGCSPETRYRTLSFFFDGVPKPGEQTAQSRLTKGRKSGTQSQKDAEKTRFGFHGPYAAKLCNACHERATNKLLLPLEELCVNCHDLDIRKKYVHGPVASGGCRVCHEPHGSGKAYLLVSEPAEFCFYCHDKVEVKSREVHQVSGDVSCTDCHNPHASDEAFMMK